MSSAELKSNDIGCDKRLPYDAPELVDRGDVSKVTQTAGITSGTDSGYS